MRISVVTPSFNQGQYLEETIESVLSQGIGDLEYIIMDGGSTDKSVEIIKRYEKYLAYWQSEKDSGQAAALNTGFERATGEVFCFLNSDDRFEPGALVRAEEEFKAKPELQLLYGDYTLVYPDKHEVPKPRVSFDFNICLYAYLIIPQPSSFWRAGLHRRIGGMNPVFPYAFDLDFYLRAGDALRDEPDSILHIHKFLSKFRIHATSKSVSESEKFVPEFQPIFDQFDGIRSPILRKIRSKYELARCVWRFWRERGVIIYKKDKWVA